jgi:hypothetical protein
MLSNDRVWRGCWRLRVSSARAVADRSCSFPAVPFAASDAAHALAARLMLALALCASVTPGAAPPTADTIGLTAGD